MGTKVTLNGELLFPNDYLSAIELKGRDVTLTISSAVHELLQKRDGKSKKELVLRFEKTPKKFVVNKTNANSIAVFLKESEASKWVGKQITIYPTKCLAFGDMTDCIRVREKPGRRPSKQLPPAEPPQDEPGNDEPQGEGSLVPAGTFDDIPY